MELKKYTQVITELEEGVLSIELNRPEKSNSYGKIMLGELIEILQNAYDDKTLKLILLSGKGKNFCTGADLKWMSDSIHLTQEENQKDFSLIISLYSLLANLEVPLITTVQGYIFGGGMGLVATSDVVYSDTKSIFSLKEISWGLIPGVITPFLVQKIGLSHFSDLSLTARELTSSEARQINLIHYVSDEPKNDALKLINKLKSLPINTLRAHKKIIKSQMNINMSQLNELAQATSKLRAEQYFNEKYNSKKS